METTDVPWRLDWLKETDWLVLLLKSQGWEASRIAQALGRSRSRVYQRLSRARLALRAMGCSSQELLARVPWDRCPAAAREQLARLLERQQTGGGRAALERGERYADTKA